MNKNSKNTEIDPLVSGLIKNLSDEENLFIQKVVFADLFYENVIDLLGIPEDNELFKNLMIGVLRRQLKDHIVLTIWQNLDDSHLKHLRDYINQAAISDPAMSNEDVLMSFADMYPNLK